MKGFKNNLERETLDNSNFHKVLYTGVNSQLVLMSLKPGEEVGLEVHPESDQFVRIEQGRGRCVIEDSEYNIEDGSGIVIPAGAEHNIVNTSTTEELKLYTLYSPPNLKDGTIHKTKEDHEENMEMSEFDGATTE